MTSARSTRSIVLGLSMLLTAGSLGAQAADGTRPTVVVDLVQIGGPREDRARIYQLLGQDSIDGYLLRSTSTRTALLPPVAGRVAWGILAPGIDLAWNSELPFSMNDGGMWAGRGVNARAVTGAYLSYGPASLILAPEFTYSRNLPFQAFPPVRLDRSAFASPWHAEGESADLPLRFGDRPLVRLLPGQSSLSVATGPVTLGASTENQWWGPGIRNSIVMSSQAAGVPHLLARTSAPVETRLGRVEARWIVGGLTESLFFDTAAANDVRSLSGVVATLRPRGEPDLTLGISRVVYGTVPSASRVPLRAFDVFAWWGRADSASQLPAGAHREQILSLFARWIFPTEGFEAYTEWARIELPASVRDFLTEPNHTQGYTVGLQWARPTAARRLVRIQSELTYLEESSTWDNRPTRGYYTSRSVPQGYTQSGQGVGAAIGPGGSSQWVAGDYVTPRWNAGLFAGRIRWENDAYYRQPSGRSYLGHDLSLYGGVRGRIPLPGADLELELRTERRFNYLFQNPNVGISGEGAVDLRNHGLQLSIYPRSAALERR